MTEENKKELPVSKEELQQIIEPLRAILDNSSANLINLDWSADRTTMTIEVGLEDRVEDRDNTYTFLDGLANFDTEQLLYSLGVQLAENYVAQKDEEDNVEEAEFTEVEETED